MAFEIYFTSTGDYKEGTFKKIIHLGKDGLYSFNTNKYLKLFKEDRDKEILQESTINTNFWMKVFTAIVAVSSALTFIIQLNTCKSLAPKKQHVSQQSQLGKNTKYNTVKDSNYLEYSKGL